MRDLGLVTTFSGVEPWPAPVRTARAILRWAAVVLALSIALAGYGTLTGAALNGRVRDQIQATGHPFVLSDLFPRWHGSQALLQGKNPYAGTCQ